MCLGPCVGPREALNEDEDGSGPGSTEPLKTFAGFSLVYLIAKSDKTRIIGSQTTGQPYHEGVRERERSWRFIARHRGGGRTG
jgi:hypothetical protein